MTDAKCQLTQPCGARRRAAPARSPARGSPTRPPAALSLLPAVTVVTADVYRDNAKHMVSERLPGGAAAVAGRPDFGVFVHTGSSTQAGLSSSTCLIKYKQTKGRVKRRRMLL